MPRMICKARRIVMFPPGLRLSSAVSLAYAV
jgi:hypothetical protein